MTQEEKDNILGNINHIPANILSEHIINKNITLNEIMETGELEPQVRVEIELIVKNREKEIKEKKLADELKEKEKEKKEWEILSKHRDLLAIEKYIEKYHSGTYYLDAVNLLEELKKNIKEKTELLDIIQNNSNEFSPDVISKYIKSDKITKKELKTIGIPEIIIESLSRESQKLELGNIPDIIEDGYTEVYFWGLPGSGKTCAISAILSTGVKDGDIHTGRGSGSHYMNQLSNIFLTKCGILPGSTVSEKVQYLPFDLTDKRGVKHPIALIELSGEVFETNYFINHDLPVDDDHLKTFKKVKSYLKGPNKKIHFFITDVTKDPTKPDQYDITQQQYLQDMMSFLDEQKVIKNTTDGVYFIATKSDTLSLDKSLWKKLAIEHLSRDYKAFINSMKSTLKKNGLPDDIYVIPFSLGDIYFNKLCIYDNSSALEIIDILKNKTNKKNNGGFINWIKKSFNN